VFFLLLILAFFVRRSKRICQRKESFFQSPMFPSRIFSSYIMLTSSSFFSFFMMHLRVLLLPVAWESAERGMKRQFGLRPSYPRTLLFSSFFLSLCCLIFPLSFSPSAFGRYFHLAFTSLGRRSPPLFPAFCRALLLEFPRIPPTSLFPLLSLTKSGLPQTPSSRANLSELLHPLQPTPGHSPPFLVPPSPPPFFP